MSRGSAGRGAAPPVVAIRAATAQDFDALCDLWRQADELHARLHPELFRVPAGLPRARGELYQLLARPSAGLLLAHRGDEVVGLAQLQVYDTPASPLMVPRRRAFLDELVVHHGHRRQGIGRRLVQCAARWAGEQGAAQLLLTVWHGNREAEAFYGALGFQPVSRQLGLELAAAAEGGQ